MALAGPRLLSRLEPAQQRREREQLAADLPLVLDLLSACLAGGASLPASVDAVARAVPGPAGRRAASVASALAVGSPAEQAWAALGGAHDDDVLAPAARALARSAASGAAAARRVGVLAVAPLGLCFLPAFVLLGVVPVVVGLAAPVLRAG